MDLIITGEYVGTSMLLNAAEVEIPNHEVPPLRVMNDAKLRAGLLSSQVIGGFLSTANAIPCTGLPLIRRLDGTPRLAACAV